MLLNHRKTAVAILITASVSSGCSVMNQVSQSATNFGGGNDVAVDDKLIIPPSLRVPEATASSAQAPTRNSKAPASQPRKSPAKAVYNNNRNYYIVVGTYPDHDEALDTFVRLSSIGLKGAAMESRVTKAGKKLHMVRLGPYTKQEDIDKAKDSLTNDGLSTFKVVEN